MTIVTRENLKAVTQNPITVVDFWAPWCGPCKMMAPVIRKLAVRFKNQIKFGTMNVNHNQDVAKRFKIFSIPSLVIFEHGRAHEKVTGYYPLTPLTNFLKQKLTEIE